jgi:uncharacterized membrane protein
MFALEIFPNIMKNENNTPKEQLDLIEKTISQAKVNLSNHSFDFIFWGWLVSLTALSNFLFLTFTSLGNKSYLIWPLSAVIGFIAIYFRYSKAAIVESHKTHIEYFIARMWMVIGSVIILLSIASPFIKIQPWLLFPVLAGIGTLVTGVVLKFNPLSFGGIVLITFPFYSILATGSSIVLLYAVVIVVSYLIPGYLLKYYKA